MKKYTVVTICSCGCEDPGQVWHRRAKDVAGAINNTYDNVENGDSLAVIAVFEGWLMDCTQPAQRLQKI